MEIVFVRNWRPFAFRGAVALLFGLIAFVRPTMTLTSLALLFAAYALSDGIFAIASGTRGRGRGHQWVCLLEGLLGCAAGFAAFVWAGMTTRLVVDVIALWAAASGILEIVIAVRLNREIPGELLLVLAGFGSLVLGVLLLTWPGTGAPPLVGLLGGYALFFGSTLLVLASRLRRLSANLSPLERTFGHTHRA